MQLETEDIYRVRAALAAILEVFEQDSQMLGLDTQGKFQQGKAINRILDNLMTGLVPIKGYAIDYSVIEINGKEWIIHRKLLDTLSETEIPVSRPLFVVGVAEQALFWKDIRRILFSNARYRVFCRLSQTGIQDYWTPVKLAHVLSLAMPNFGAQIDNLGTEALRSMMNASQLNVSTEHKSKPFKNALLKYADLLAAHYDHSLTTSDLFKLDTLLAQHSLSTDSLEARRTAFDIVSSHVLDQFQIEREPEVVAKYREPAMLEVGLELTGSPIVKVATMHLPPSEKISEDRFLDSEFVAIYW